MQDAEVKKIKYSTSFEEPKKISNKKLQAIIQFYLLECPVKGVSQRGKTFEELGYIGPKSFNTLKKSLLKAATPSLLRNYIPCKQGELSSGIKQCEAITFPDEYCVFLRSDEKSVIRSLFSAIRNALAHGSFNVKSYNRKRVYFFSNFKGYEKARIVLYEETLLSWIKIIRH